MPGIVGLVTKMPRAWAEPQLLRMLETMRHESFYVTGTFIDETLGLYVGWVARKDSFSDRMPVRNERGDVVLIFAGEEYPAPNTPRDLKARGHNCELEGASYLAHRYEEDPNFLKNLNGRFHGMMADLNRSTATLFNDRFGLQRVCFHEAKDAFYFSAEAKAILAVRPELRSMDPRGIGEFISSGCVLQNRTLFTGIYALPAASAWSFRAGVLEKKAAYFEPREWEEQEPLGEEAYYQQLREAFTTRLPRYFNGRERIGVSLTGGLDTRIIMAWRKAPPGDLPCYTFGSMYRENQDVCLARRVAEICGQPYQVVTDDERCLSRFAHYAERTLYLTDGSVDIARSVDLWNNEMARQIAPVRMVGTFGSEIIRKSVMFKAVAPSPVPFSAETFAEVARGIETYRGLLRGNRTSLVAFCQTAAYHFGVVMLEQTQLTLRSPYLDNEIVRTVFQSPPVEQGEDVRLRLIRDGSPELARLRTDRGLGIMNPLTAAISRAFLEFTFKAEYAYDYGMPQWVAKVDHAFAPLHLERLWMGRHKLFHFRWWYRTILAKYVQEILLDARSLARPYVDRKGVEAVVSGHLKGNRNYTTEIHRLLSLELLHRLFVDAR
jgi:asparagine synthase (glutamine-hydrolysing)